MPTATPFKTACGRMFDPTVFEEVLQAMCDQGWAQAIQKQLVQDREYMDMLQKEGGAAKTVDEMCSRGFANDEDALNKLKALLQDDRKTALSLCAITDGYTRIREKRDLSKTQTAADGHDPLESVRQKTPDFGDRIPTGK